VLKTLRSRIDVEDFPVWVAGCLLLAIGAALCAGFAANTDCLFIGLDGETWVNVLKVQAESRTAFTQTGVDPLAGSFDAYHPTFREYLLPTALGMLVGQPVVSKAATYAIYGLMLVLSCFAVGRAVGFTRIQSLLGAGALPVLALPVVSDRMGFLFPLLALNPHIAQIMALSLLIVAALWALQDRPLPTMLALGAVPAVCAVVATLSLAASAILMAPAVLVYGGASLLSRPTWRNLAARALAGLVAAGAMIALGFAHYYYALFNYTAYHFFASRMLAVANDIMFVSMYFWTEPAGYWLIILGCVGAFYALLYDTDRLRVFAATHLAVTAAFFAAGLSIHYFARSYAGPSPVYFETCMWPYSCLFAASFVTRIAGLPALAARSLSRSLPAWIEKAAVIAAAGALVYLATMRPNAPLASCPASFSHTKATPLTDLLRREIAVSPGRRFGGLAATFTGMGDRPSVDWSSLHAYDGALSGSIGNEHRIVGLWSFAIPTLFQYFSFITPPYYLVVTHFLARAEDLQSRSTLVLTRIDEGIMRLLGVRYVITDRPSAPGMEAANVPVPDQAPLRLMELSDVNLGQYSPVEVKRVSDFSSAIAAMEASEFDGRRTVVTQDALDGPLETANSVELIYERDGFRLRAVSPVRSLLVLPIQFSRCWTIDDPKARLFRANVMQLGVAFSGSLDARLVFRFGPIWASGCRIADFDDMRRLKIDAVN
jgi:hypothetical protein